MDLEYIQKYTFTEGGCGGMPFNVESNILTTSLTGGNSISTLFVPGGLVYHPCEYSGKDTHSETDPWKVEVKEDFDQLLDLVSLNQDKSKPNQNQNKTMKKKRNSK